MIVIKTFFLIIILLLTVCFYFWFLSPYLADKILSANLPFETQNIQVIKKGIFIGNKGFFGKGNVQLISYNNKNYIHFEENFSVSDKSDLYVYLNTNGNNKQAVNLGLLKKYKGAQLYIIPNTITVNDYYEVSLWSNGYSLAYANAILE